MYQLSNRFRSEWPTPEEEMVLTALKHYCFDRDKTTVQDFTPTIALYEAYRKYANDFDLGTNDCPELLNPTQFGVALRRVFHLDPQDKVQRRINGRRVAGYVGVTGPESVRVYTSPGNPKLRRRKCTTASTEKISGFTST